MGETPTRFHVETPPRSRTFSTDCEYGTDGPESRGKLSASLPAIGVRTPHQLPATRPAKTLRNFATSQLAELGLLLLTLRYCFNKYLLFNFNFCIHH